MSNDDVDDVLCDALMACYGCDENLAWPIILPSVRKTLLVPFRTV